MSLNQGRYTFRHDSILNYIQQCLDTTKYRIYIDIEGHQTQDGGTIPPEFMITTLKPDIVIIDEKSKIFEIFELTVPGELRISAAHNLKLEKYQHFSTDILRLKTTVTPFEIGSNTGYISRENKENIKRIHKYCKREIKLKNNISAIAVLGSYYIFNNRNIEYWHTPSKYIHAPMTNM